MTTPCTLDLTVLLKNPNIEDPYGVKNDLVSKYGWVYTNAQSIVLDSIDNVVLFQNYVELFPPPIYQTKPTIHYILVDDGNGKLQIYPAVPHLSILLTDSNGNFVVPPTIVEDDIFLRFADQNNPRINLKNEPGYFDACKQGYYGYIGNRTTTEPYVACFVSQMDSFLGDPNITGDLVVRTTGDLPYPRILHLYKTKISTVTNERGPLVISDITSRKANLGTSIIDDDVACPKDPGLFSATDIDFGQVFLGTSNEGTITISNIGKVPLKLTGIALQQTENFTLLDFEDTNALLPLPTEVNSGLNAISMPVGTSLKFKVKYDSKEEVDVTHRSEIIYTVQTDVTNTTQVFSDKINSILTGIGYNVSVTCTDVDWATVDANNSKNKQEITITNSGTRPVYLYGYTFGDISKTYFDLDPVLNVSETSPIEILANGTYVVGVNYNPKLVVGQVHTDFVQFLFKHGDSKQFDVIGKKTISNLKATATTDDIDDVIDEFDDTDDDTYKVLSRVLDKSAIIRKNRTFPLWSCGSDRLNQIFTGSNGTKVDNYYLSIFNKPTNQTGSQHQFDIAYGHVDGSGSSYFDGNSLVDLMPAKSMYHKHLVECYSAITGSGNIPKKFTFRNGVQSDYVYFIQLDRDDYKDMLDPGNFQFSLVPLSSSANQLYNTGSNFYANTSSSVIYQLIDDSRDTKQVKTDDTGLNTFYYIVSGTLQQGPHGDGTENAWGMVFPKLGLIVLDGTVLDQSCSFNTVTASMDGDNIYKFFVSLSGSMTATNVRPVSQSFYARSAETAFIQTLFCRANPEEFNYSNNPTYSDGQTNIIRYPSFVREPKTYITTIGLYNKNLDLLAVGKLKQPILKTDKTQYIFQIKLRIR